MEQTNIATRTVRRIRRFGLTFEPPDGPTQQWEPASVGELKAANGGVQT